MLTIDDPDGAHQAHAANSFGADIYLGLATATGSAIAFYATTGFESLGGHRMADLLHEELAPVLGGTLDRPAGMRLPVLRETKMPAVLIELAASRAVTDQSPAVAGAIGRALALWVGGPGNPRSTVRVCPQGYSQVCMTLNLLVTRTTCSLDLSDQTIDPLKILAVWRTQSPADPCCSSW